MKRQKIDEPLAEIRDFQATTIDQLNTRSAAFVIKNKVSTLDRISAFKMILPKEDEINETAQDEEDEEVTGYFTFPKYLKTYAKANETFSDCIIKEGKLYRLIFLPQMTGKYGSNTHIGIGIQEHSMKRSKTRYEGTVPIIVEMLHSVDETKNFKQEYDHQFEEEWDTSKKPVLFYRIDDLKNNGFIHEEDQSLRFKFTVKNHNFQQRAEDAEE